MYLKCAKMPEVVVISVRSVVKKKLYENKTRKPV